MVGNFEWKRAPGGRVCSRYCLHTVSHDILNSDRVQFCTWYKSPFAAVLFFYFKARRLTIRQLATSIFVITGDKITAAVIKYSPQKNFGSIHAGSNATDGPRLLPPLLFTHYCWTKEWSQSSKIIWLPSYTWCTRLEPKSSWISLNSGALSHSTEKTSNLIHCISFDTGSSEKPTLRFTQFLPNTSLL